MRNERGSATPLLALLVVVLGGFGFGLARLGALVDARAAAQAAADAAALAGAAEGAGAARALADANGAEVVRLDRDDAEVEVEVRLGRVEAVARAIGEPEAPPIGAAGVTGLVPELRAALAEAERLLGRPVPITSGWRSTATQQRLYDDRASNPYPVARPGTSMHERGRAVDVPRGSVSQLAAIAVRVGLCHPWPDTDPVHFELCRRTP